MERVRASHDQAVMTLDGFEAELDQRRVELGRAAQRRAVLDRLKARHAADSRAAADRVEHALLDEVALAQHRRQVAP